MVLYRAHGSCSQCDVDGESNSIDFMIMIWNMAFKQSTVHYRCRRNFFLGERGIGDVPLWGQTGAKGYALSNLTSCSNIQCTQEAYGSIDFCQMRAQICLVRCDGLEKNPQEHSARDQQLLRNTRCGGRKPFPRGSAENLGSDPSIKLSLDSGET